MRRIIAVGNTFLRYGGRDVENCAFRLSAVLNVSYGGHAITEEHASQFSFGVGQERNLSIFDLFSSSGQDPDWTWIHSFLQNPSGLTQAQDDHLPSPFRPATVAAPHHGRSDAMMSPSMPGYGPQPPAAEQSSQSQTSGLLPSVAATPNATPFFSGRSINHVLAPPPSAYDTFRREIDRSIPLNRCKVPDEVSGPGHASAREEKPLDNRPAKRRVPRLIRDRRRKPATAPRSAHDAGIQNGGSIAAPLYPFTRVEPPQSHSGTTVVGRGAWYMGPESSPALADASNQPAATDGVVATDYQTPQRGSQAQLGSSVSHGHNAQQHPPPPHADADAVMIDARSGLGEVMSSHEQSMAPLATEKPASQSVIESEEASAVHADSDLSSRPEDATEESQAH